jgi:hypothetical protein
MQIGDLTGKISKEIQDLVFTFTDGINLVGFTLQKKKLWGSRRINLKKISEKIDNLFRFCERFFLSLPGKIKS